MEVRFDRPKKLIVTKVGSKMRYVNCNLCGSEKYVLIDSHRNDTYCKPEIEVRTVICKNCALVYMNPQLDESELHNLYSTTYASTRSDLPSERKLLSKERLGDLDSPRTVLDIGCGAGSLLNAFSKRGWNTCGIEPTPHWAKFVRQRYGLKVTAGFLETANLPDCYFDLVTLNHTLEHLANPTQALLTIRNSLKDEGMIYIDVPNVFKPIGPKFFEAPHLYYFSLNTLSLLLEKTGFELRAWASEHRKLRRLDIWVLAKKVDMRWGSSRSRHLLHPIIRVTDDYRIVIMRMRAEHIRSSTPVWVRSRIGSTIRHIFGESTGRKILGLIKGWLHLEG